MRAAWLIGATVVLASGAAAAQPPSTAPPPTPQQVIERVQARYRAGPVCERLSVELRADSGRVARSWAIVRTAPPAAGEPPVPGPRLMLELGPLRVSADGRSVRAVHERNPQIFFSTPLVGEGELTSERLRSAIPPVPMFQLDLLNSPSSERLAEFTPYARSVQWTEAAADPRMPSRVTLTGTADVGPVTLVVRNDQVQQVELRDERRGVSLRVQVSPVAPCRESDLEVDIAARTPVERLSDLQPRSGVLRVGSPVPEMQLSTAAGQVQRLRELFTPPPEFLPAPDAERLVLVFTRRQGPEWSRPARLGRVELAELGKSLHGLQRDIYAPRITSPGAKTPDTGSGSAPDEPLLATFNFAQVMVLESPPPAEDLLKLIKDERRVWGASQEEDGSSGEHLAWATDARTSVDLFAASGESVAIIIDSQLALRQVFPIGEHTTTEQLLDQITAALMDTSGQAR